MYLLSKFLFYCICLRYCWEATLPLWNGDSLFLAVIEYVVSMVCSDRLGCSMTCLRIVLIYNSLFTFSLPLTIDKAFGFWFCFLLFADLVSADSLFDSLSGHGCAAQHIQPLSLARWVYLSLQIHTLCHNLPEWCSHAPSNMLAIQGLSLSLCSFILLAVAYTCKYTMALTHRHTQSTLETMAENW